MLQVRDMLMRLGRAGGDTGAAAAACVRPVTLKDEAVWPGAVHPAARLPMAARMSRHVKTFLFLALAGSSTAFGVTPNGTVIPNQAKVNLVAPGDLPIEVETNRVETTVFYENTNPADIQLHRFVPTPGGGTGSIPIPDTLCRDANGNTAPLPREIVIPGQGTYTIGGGVEVATQPEHLFHSGEPLLITVGDIDHNFYADRIETANVTVRVPDTGDVERLTLSESGPNTGVFVGYIQTTKNATVVNNCILTVGQNTRVIISYDDHEDLVVDADVLIDPFGILFDSVTGAPVDGAIVSMIDADTGLPATVVGDDGFSAYPSTVISGGSATDASGVFYDFPPGEYRFPFAPPGNYIIVVQPPAGYEWPSQVPDNILQNLPGAPWALTVGSRGETFVLEQGPPLNIDIPLVPLTTGLFVAIGASQQIAALGDFVQFTVDVQNTSGTNTTINTVLADQLPVGFRYVPGSGRYTPPGGVPTPLEPTIGGNGRGLSWALGNLPASSTGVVTFVTEVVPGARAGNLQVDAHATATSGESSNTALVQLQVRDELMQNVTTIVGEILVDACGKGQDEGPFEGVPRVRVMLEDGSYAVTDERGRFHFRGVAPGTHVVQLDPASIPEGYEAVLCRANTRHAGKATSQFAELSPGSLWRADFFLTRRAADESELSAQLTGTLGSTGQADYRLHLVGGRVPVSNVRATVLVPEGATLVPDSLQVDGQTLPASADEGVITLRLGDLGADWERAITFRLSLALGGETLQETKAVVSFDGPTARNQRTKPLVVGLQSAPLDMFSGKLVLQPQFDIRKAELKDSDKAVLSAMIRDLRNYQSLRFVVTGHTDNVRIAPHNRHEFADNIALSKARAQALVDFLVAEFGIDPSRIVAIGKGESEPIADNGTPAGRAMNRRVEIAMFAAAEGKGGVSEGQSPRDIVKVSGARPGESLKPAVIEKVDAKDAAQNYAPYAKELTPKFLASLDATPAILWPGADSIPTVDAIKIAVKHPKSHQATVSVGGVPVPGLNFGGTYSGTNGVAVTEWTGVKVREGANRVLVTLSDADGNVVQTLESVVHYSGAPVRAELVPERSRLVADGREPPVIALRVFDRFGKPVRAGTSGQLDIAAPYESYMSVEDLQQQQLMTIGPRETVYSVGADGIALVQLMPTTQSGEVLVTLQFNPQNQQQRQEVRAWLEADARDWVMVGLAEGTVGHRIVSDKAEFLATTGADDAYYEDGRIAFYAKGAVKGEYLLTVAYDTRRGQNLGGGQFEQTIDPNAYYLLYGDAGEQRHDAASRRNLYLKIERRQFYALFGDFDAGLTYTELSRYSRRLTGAKSELRGDRWQYTAFASENSHAFQRDELQGDGTSGIYKLSRRPLVINTDRIGIEVRDRFQSDKVLSRRELTRFVDYTIDYLAGTVFFKEPVPSRDSSFNPVYVVAEYEVQGSGVGGVTGGGRGAVKLADGRVELGVTAIHEGVQGAEGDLYGADLRLQVGAGTELRAELASSDKLNTGITSAGDAHSVELKHQGEKVSGRVYLKEQEAGFGLGQQSGGEGGTRKSGVEGQVRLTDEMSVDARAYQQEVLLTGATNEVAEAALRYAQQDNDWSATVGVRRAEDQTSIGTSLSEQGFVGGSVQVTDQLSVRASAELGLDQKGAAVDHPDRLLIGADYRFTEKAGLFVEHEIAQGQSFDSDMTRVGVRAEPWDKARVDTSLTQQINENGARTFATMGLTQGWQATEDLLLDFGVDRVHTVSAGGPLPLNPNLPPSSGTTAATGDFTAFHAGATFKRGDLSLASRLEMVTGDQQDKLGFIVNMLKQENERLGYSAGFQWLDSETAAGATDTRANVRFGLSWRPSRADWIIYDRLDLVYQDLVDPLSTASTTWKAINNLNANWQRSDRLEMSFQHGIKLNRTNVGGRSYSSVTDLYGFESRWDLGSRWDVGAHVGLLHSWESGVADYGWGVSLGRDVFENVWLSVGYNFDGYYDEDFTAARWTARGPYLKFRIKFDQDSLRDAAAAMEGGPRP